MTDPLLPPTPADYLGKAQEALRQSHDERAQTYALLALVVEIRALREALSP